MKKLFLTTLMALALFFMASFPSHAASGTYIDCIHGCPNLIACKNCCNETFSDVLSTCNGNPDRNNCLQRVSRNFDCPNWKGGMAGGFKNPGFPLGQSFFQKNRSECKECHEDDR